MALSRKITPEKLEKLDGGKFKDFSDVTEKIVGITKQRAMDAYFAAIVEDDSLIEGKKTKELYESFLAIMELWIPVNHILHFIEYKFPTYLDASKDKFNNIAFPVWVEVPQKKIFQKAFLKLLDVRKPITIRVRACDMNELISVENPRDLDLDTLAFFSETTDVDFDPNISDEDIFKQVSSFVKSLWDLELKGNNPFVLMLYWKDSHTWKHVDLEEVISK